MAIAGVGSFSKSLTDGLSREGRVILGGDLAFSLIHREATPRNGVSSPLTARFRRRRRSARWREPATTEAR